MIVSKTNKIRATPANEVGSGWVGYLLNQAALRIRTMTAAALSPLELTPPQLRVLETIANEQPLSQTRLGELVGMDRTTIVHVIDRFEQIGVASREPDLADRRSHAVVLTKVGVQNLAKAQISARDAENDFLAELSHSEREALHALLHKLFNPSPCPEEKKREYRTPPPNP